MLRIQATHVISERDMTHPYVRHTSGDNSIAQMTLHLQAHIHTPCEELHRRERWGAGVETQKNARGEIGGWGRVPFNETYAPS